jgi:hypothetical protein
MAALGTHKRDFRVLVITLLVLATLIASMFTRAGYTRSRCSNVGTKAADHLIGTSRKDVLCGLLGSDLIRGVAGVDVLIGGRGVDDLNGGHGRDVVRGMAGADILVGGHGRDRLLGGSGGDSISAVDGGRYDTVNGGAGDDHCLVDLHDTVLNCEHTTQI